MEWRTTSAVLTGLRDFDNRSSWQLLVEHFRQPIVRFARRLGLSETDAEDAAQETLLAFARAFREGGYSKERGRLRSWLFGVAQNQIQNARRRIAQRSDRECGRIAEPEARKSVPQSIWRDEWRRSTYERALEQVRSEVTEPTFETFRLLVFEELSVAEVANRFSVPRTRVYNAKHRVATRIRELVEGYDDA